MLFQLFHWRLLTSQLLQSAEGVLPTLIKQSIFMSTIQIQIKPNIIIQIISNHILIQTRVNKFDLQMFFLTSQSNNLDQMTAPYLNIYLITFYLSIDYTESDAKKNPLLLLLHNQMHIVRDEFFISVDFRQCESWNKKQRQQYLLAIFFQHPISCEFFSTPLDRGWEGAGMHSFICRARVLWFSFFTFEINHAKALFPSNTNCIKLFIPRVIFTMQRMKSALNEKEHLIDFSHNIASYLFIILLKTLFFFYIKRCSTAWLLYWKLFMISYVLIWWSQKELGFVCAAFCWNWLQTGDGRMIESSRSISSVEEIVSCEFRLIKQTCENRTFNIPEAKKRRE